MGTNAAGHEMLDGSTENYVQRQNRKVGEGYGQLMLELTKEDLSVKQAAKVIAMVIQWYVDVGED